MTVSCGFIIALQFAAFEECWQFGHFGVLTVVVLARAPFCLFRGRSEWSQEITTGKKQNLRKKVAMRSLRGAGYLWAERFPFFQDGGTPRRSRGAVGSTIRIHTACIR